MFKHAFKDQVKSFLIYITSYLCTNFEICFNNCKEQILYSYWKYACYHNLLVIGSHWDYSGKFLLNKNPINNAKAVSFPCNSGTWHFWNQVSSRSAVFQVSIYRVTDDDFLHPHKLEQAS